MNGFILLGVIWICVSIYNYLKFIPEEQKRKTNLISFVGFAALSPLVTLVFYVMYFFNRPWK